MISDGTAGILAGNAKTKLILATSFDKGLLEGSSKLKVCYNNSLLPLVVDAVKGFNKVPTGCFEQASSKSFPLAVSLLILKDMGD